MTRLWPCRSSSLDEQRHRFFRCPPGKVGLTPPALHPLMTVLGGGKLSRADCSLSETVAQIDAAAPGVGEHLVREPRRRTSPAWMTKRSRYVEHLRMLWSVIRMGMPLLLQIFRSPGDVGYVPTGLRCCSVWSMAFIDVEMARLPAPADPSDRRRSPPDSESGRRPVMVDGVLQEVRQVTRPCARLRGFPPPPWMRCSA